MEGCVQKKICVSEEELAKLEGIVKELSVRLTSVEDCLLGLDGMKDRMCLLEKSMENALDRIMPRLDSLLAGLPTSATSHIAAKPPISPGAAPVHSRSPACSSRNAVSKSRDRPVSNITPPESSSPRGVEAKNSQKNSPTVVAASMKVCANKTTQPAGSSKCTKNEVSLRSPSVTSSEKRSVGNTQTKGIERARQFLNGLAFGVVIAVEHKRENGEIKATKSKKKIAQMKEAVGRGDLITCMKLVQLGADPSQLDIVMDSSTPLNDMQGGQAMCITFLKEVVKSKKHLSVIKAKDKKQEIDQEKPSGSKDNGTNEPV